MTVCANRTDNPGFFTGCSIATGKGCTCGDQLRAELLKQQQTAANPPMVTQVAYVRWTCPSCGDTAQARADYDIRCACGTVTRTPPQAAPEASR